MREEYRYGEFQNVVTSMDYERLLSSTGPYGGEILRASDLKHPHKVAWIQCVGSRQVLEGGNSYCSAVCCTYTQKQVILTKDHHPESECTIFHNDVRSYGKDFERYYQRTENLPGVRFFRSYTSIVKEDPVTKNVTVRYSTTDDGVKEEEFDMVVLSVGLNPPKDALEIAKKYGIELSDHDFCKLNPGQPHGDQQARDLCKRRLPGSRRYPRVGLQRQRRRLPDRRAPRLPAGQPHQRKDISGGKGRLRRRSRG